MKKITIGNCTLYNADCRDVLPELGRFDCLLSDPPYGLAEKLQGGTWGKSYDGDYQDWDHLAPDFLPTITAICNRSIIWGGNYFTLPPSRAWLVWSKPERGLTMADGELAWCSWDGNLRIKELSRNPNNEKRDHPTQKPTRLMQWCIHQADKQSHNATIFDPFMGSGSTAMACILEGRTFTGIEREPRYFDAACERIERATAQGRLFTDA